MKVLKGQDANLKSSKGFYRGSRSTLKGGARLSNIHAPRFLEIYKNLWKCKKIYTNPKQSMKMYKIAEKPRKSKKNQTNPSQFMENSKMNENLEKPRSQL